MQTDEHVHKMVQRIEAFGPKLKGQRYCTIEHIQELYPEGRFSSFDNLKNVAAYYLSLPEAQQEYLLQFLVNTEEEALSLFTRSCYNYAFNQNSSLPAWPNLHFSQSGFSRLANIAGYIQGLAHAGEETRKMALKMASQLNNELKRLSDYGGDIEIPCQSDSKATIKVPRYRVVLNDDGCLHSFSLAWYAPVSNAKRLEVAERIRSERQTGTEQLAKAQDEAIDYRLWDECIQAANEDLKLKKELELYRYYKPSWSMPENHSSCNDTVHFAYSHNGGLIFHGPGSSETFTVSIGNNDRYWGVHT
jgi:hypothetical protein